METIPTLAALLFVVLLLRYWRYRRLPLPPGPPGRLLIGNVLEHPKTHAWYTYAKWAKHYDPDIMYLNLMGQSLIVLNSFSAAEELLDRRSGIYSDRPGFPMVGDLMGWNYITSAVKYGDTWRQHRKLIYQSFNSSAVTQFKPHIMKTVHGFMRNLLAKPDHYRYFVRHMTSEVILLITYGIQIQPEDDPYVENAEKALSTFTEAAMPGQYLVDVFPWLKYVPEWMPFAEFKRQAKEWREYTVGMVEKPYRAVREDILAGNGKGINSLVADGLNAVGDDVSFSEWETIVKHVAGTMYAAASDTTVSTILSGILVLMCYPEVLKKARAEIDTVVKPGNLPEFDDIETLPYFSAFMKELWRWYPALPLGVPHFIETDDIYKGYLIPGQSIILPNMWGMTHNGEIYPDPHTFNPDRFLKDGALNTELQDPERIVFGFGRRICAGSHFATMSVKITMASIITLFDISKPLDDNGNPIEPPMEFTATGISHPVPFKCTIVPRSGSAVEAIQRTEAYEYFNE